jgi:transcriptional regulator with XRE-family HTH domain
MTKLKFYMEQKGITLGELAKESGSSIGSIFQYREGRVAISKQRGLGILSALSRIENNRKSIKPLNIYDLVVETEVEDAT